MSAFIHTDVAQRDFDYLRARASRKANATTIISMAAVGACADGTCATSAPVCPDYSIDYLCANYYASVQTFIALAAGATTTITFNPLDSVFCPVAVAGRVVDSADATLVRTSRVFDVNIRKCSQLEWSNPADTVAGATAWFDILSEWDPQAKGSCRACPVDWGCFTNTGQGSALLTMIIGNPHAAPVTGKITLWGIPYTCCPAFYGDDRMKTGARRPITVPAPIGTAKRPGGSAFAG